MIHHDTTRTYDSPFILNPKKTTRVGVPFRPQHFPTNHEEKKTSFRYHEFIQIALYLYERMGANVLLIEPPPEFSRDVKRWVEAAPGVILAVLDDCKVKEFALIALGYGGCIALRLLMMAKHRFSMGTHILINPCYPEGMDLPDATDVKQVFYGYGNDIDTSRKQFWVIRIKQPQNQFNARHKFERSTAEKRNVGEDVLRDNFVTLLEVVRKELAVEKTKNPERLCGPDKRVMYSVGMRNS